MGCLAIPVEHTQGNWEVAEDGIVGVDAAETIEEAAEIAGVARPGMPLAGTKVDTEPATPGIGLEDLGTALVDTRSAAPDIVLVVGTGIVDFSTLFCFAALRLVACSQ